MKALVLRLVLVTVFLPGMFVMALCDALKETVSFFKYAWKDAGS